jgi:hypothetical protein
MALGLDMLAVVSICPPDSRPHGADNIIQIGTSLWDLWSYINEMIHDSEGDFDEDDVWVLTWEVYWDLDEVVHELETGQMNDDGTEETIPWTVYEVLEDAQEVISQDRQWLGEDNEDLRDPDNVGQMALHVTATISGLPIVTMGQDVFNPELNSFIEWRSRLYGGVWIKEA